MRNFEVNAVTAARHGDLVGRAGAILSCVEPAPGRLATILRDEGETAPPPPRREVLSLALGKRPALLTRPGQRNLALHYADGSSDATLAALIAAATAQGEPIARDVTSLSALALAARLAATDIPVLINGPTGTGKEVLSRFIHARSPRADKPFVAINCAAVPEAMLEAMLFGHQKGAVPGAANASEGFFRAADGGTLLLDEIAEMPLGLQAKLLRALQEGEVMPLGATQPVKIDVRIIACANRDLPTEVAEGRFRADLFYRLNVFPLALTALCERRDDIAPLAFALLLRHRSAGSAVEWISDEALALLEDHSWPGNVRELENVVRRALVLAGSDRVITAAHISFDRPARLVTEPAAPMALAPVAQAKSGSAGGNLSSIVRLSEADAIRATLDACAGHRGEAARRLGISERTLRYRLASFRDAGLAAAAPAMAGGRA